MRFSAISYRVAPGSEDEVGKLLDADEAAVLGPEPGPVRAAAAFLHDTTLMRVLQHEGELADVLRHLVARPGFVDTERRLAALAEDPATLAEPDQVAAFLAGREMRAVQQRTIHEQVAAQLSALRYRVKPGHAEDIGAVFADVQAEARPALRDDRGQEVGLILAVALFVRDDSMIRVVQHSGDLADVAAYMAARGGRPDMERRLAPYLAEERHVGTREEFLEQFRRNTMRRLRDEVTSAT